MLFSPSCFNVEMKDNLLQRMNGNIPVLITPTGKKIIGLFEYEVNNRKRLMFNDTNNFYQYNDNGTYSNIKSGLTYSENCNYCQYLQKMAVCNGVDELFTYDVTTGDTIETNLVSQMNTVGKVCSSFASRLVVADGVNLYLSALGDETNWVNQQTNGVSDPDNVNTGFQIANFMSNTDKITCMMPYGAYLAIFTNKHVYFLSGSDNSNFAVQLFGNVGTSSPHGAVKFYRDGYFFSNDNMSVYLLDQFYSMGQLEIGDSVTRRAFSDFINTIDKNLLNKIKFIPYINRNQVWMYVPSIASGDTDTCYTFDFNYTSMGANAPSFIPIFKRQQNIISAVGNYLNNIYTGDATGQIYLEDQGNKFAGQYFNFSYLTPYFDFNERSMYKNCEYVKLWFNTKKQANCNIIFNFNQHADNPKNRPVSLPNKYGVWGLSKWGACNYLVMDEKSKLKTVGGRFTSVQMGITGTSNMNDFALRMFSFINFQQIGSY
jgi:hypothetical protein